MKLLCIAMWALLCVAPSVLGHAEAVELTIGPPPTRFYPQVQEALSVVTVAFNAQHPGIVIRLSESQPEISESQLTREQMGDILFISDAGWDRDSLVAQYAEQDCIIPLDDFTEDPSFVKSDFFPNLWDLVTYKDHVWALPVTVRSWALAVDPSQDLATQGPLQLSDWSGLKACLAEGKLDLDGDGVFEASSVAFSQPYLLLQSLYLQEGGDPNSANHPDLSSAAWQTALSQYRAIVSSNPAMAGAPSSTGNLSASPFALKLVNDDPMSPISLTLARIDQPALRVLPFPGKGGLPNLDVTVLAIRKSDPATEAAAWTFLKWFASARFMTEFYPQFGITPLRESAVKALGNEDTLVFAAQIKRMRFQRPLLKASDFNLRITDLLQETTPR